MSLLHVGLKAIHGPLIILDQIKGIGYEEVVAIKLENGTIRRGRVVQIDGTKVAIQVFEGTSGLSLINTKTEFLGHPMTMSLSKEVLGRTFNGSGDLIDDLGPIYVHEKRDINGSALNPVSRIYPRNYIQTGISSIDALTTLIRGQKLPIFSGSGLPHNELAVQIVKQAHLSDGEANFAIVFAAMGVKNDVAEYFRRSFSEAGVMDHVAMFINLANDPIIERTITPRVALTTAEYLAYTNHMHVLVIMTDMSAYCEALREFSSSKGEIPGRKGYPGYLYSDLASLYERAGIVAGTNGSVTQIPILTMPNDDITHPVPDLTGYITEGQMVLDRDLHQKGIYPPIGVLPSLSRLMKDGIGAGFTRADHSILSNQLFASYSKVQNARSLASVIGEDELSPIDQEYLVYGELFEKHFLGQKDVNRTIIETLDLGWRLLSLLPKTELDRIDSTVINTYYNHEAANTFFNIRPKTIIRAVAKNAGK
ncbi:MAG: V-type ATP synthase subunit B [Bacilli bacterium]|nr:V-type ATP synthase subunit B [Bacilli bacterium]